MRTPNAIVQKDRFPGADVRTITQTISVLGDPIQNKVVDKATDAKLRCWTRALSNEGFSRAPPAKDRAECMVDRVGKERTVEVVEV